MFISYYGLDDIGNDDLMTNSWNNVGFPLT